MLLRSQVRRVLTGKSNQEGWEGYHSDIPANAVQKYTKARAGFIKCEAPVTRASAGPPRLLFFSFMMYLLFQLALECVGPSQRQRVGSYLLSI